MIAPHDTPTAKHSLLEVRARVQQIVIARELRAPASSADTFDRVAITGSTITAKFVFQKLAGGLQYRTPGADVVGGDFETHNCRIDGTQSLLTSAKANEKTCADHAREFLAYFPDIGARLGKSRQETHTLVLAPDRKL